MEFSKLFTVLVFLLFASSACAEPTKVEFGRDVRPILAGKCFACHGPDENHREADLRLDLRDEAIDYGAIQPGSLDSELIRRILSDDPDEVMPPPASGDALSVDEKQVLKQWIESGAEYTAAADERLAFNAGSEPRNGTGLSRTAREWNQSDSTC